MVKVESTGTSLWALLIKRTLEIITTGPEAGDEVDKREEKELQDTNPRLANAKPVERDDLEFLVVHILNARIQESSQYENTHMLIASLEQTMALHVCE